jgi:biopolymer transport protein ExbD
MAELQKQGADPLMTEVNLTPLIDVCLVLVVILLVATPMTLESAIAVRNAAAAGAKAELKSKDERIEIRIIDDNTVAINGRQVNRWTVASRLRPLIEASSTGRVVVSCEPGTTHGTFVNVLDQAKLSGAADIAVLGK